MSGATRAAVKFGMAGVIFAGTTRQLSAAETTTLDPCFRLTPLAARTEWRSDNAVVITYHHAHDTGTSPGSYQVAIPRVGDWRGVLFGSFFGARGCGREPAAMAERMLQRHAANRASGFLSLNGAWAAVVWNDRTGETCFARDPIGVETLFVRQLSDRTLFSTDLRVLQPDGILPELDDQAAAEFLHYLYVPSPRTITANVVSVLPGHTLVAGGSMKQEPYATSRFSQSAALPDEAAIDSAMRAELPRFEEKLLQAVADCIPATGRVALMLSGGKDSSTLAVALARLCPARVLAVNVGMRDPRFDEADDAALVCRHLGLAFESWIPSDSELAHGIYRFAREHDQPWGDPAALPYFLAMDRLPEDCTVVLDGTGNDYYFGMPSRAKGVHRYRLRLQVQERMPDPVWRSLVQLMARGPERVRQLGRFWARPVEESFVAWEGWSLEELTALLQRPVSVDDTYLWQLMREWHTAGWLPLLTEVVARVWEPHTAYRKAVNLARAAGRGIRFPFIDARLAEYVRNLPADLKFRGDVNKYLLRAYMHANLPGDIVEKPKSPFVFDLNRLLLNPVHRWPDELHNAGRLKVVPTWADAPVHALLASHRRAPADIRWQHRLYALSLLATVVALSQGYEPVVGETNR